MWTKNEIPIIVRHIQFLTTNWTNFTVNTYASPSSLANISTSAIYWIYVGVVKKFNTFEICNQILGQKCSFSFIGLGVFSNNENYLNLQISVNIRSTTLIWICYFHFQIFSTYVGSLNDRTSSIFRIIFTICLKFSPTKLWICWVSFHFLDHGYQKLNYFYQRIFSPNATKSSCQIFFHTSWWLKCVFYKPTNYWTILFML